MEVWNGTDPAPRGAYLGGAPQTTACTPPNENCAPTSEDCAPKKLTGSGLLECRSRPKLVFATGVFVIFWSDTGFHDIFGVKTFFFFGDHLFSAGNPLQFQ